MAHMYNGILLSHKKEWNNAMCSNMDGPRDYHIKWRQRKTNTICGTFLKKWYKWTSSQNRNQLTDTENKPMLTKREEGVGEG